MATAIGVSSAQHCTPVKYADLWLLLCLMPVLYPSHRHIPSGHDASLSGHWRGEQSPTSVIESLTAGSCDWLGVCGTETIFLILSPFLSWCAFIPFMWGKPPANPLIYEPEGRSQWKPVHVSISAFLFVPVVPGSGKTIIFFWYWRTNTRR